MIVFGYGGTGHDFSTCIFKDNKIAGFIEDERILREKHAVSSKAAVRLLNNESLSYCQEQAGISIEEADYIVANSSIKSYYISRKPRKGDIHMINHHLSHASSTFYPSDFEEAAILVIDGSGISDNEHERDTISMWHGNGKNIKKILSHTGRSLDEKKYKGVIYPDENSIGAFYHIITHLVGFGGFNEGKTMGLAPYGTDKYYKFFREMIDFGDEGKFLLSENTIDEIVSLRDKMNIKDFQERADIAWAAQAITEDAVIHSAKYLKKVSDSNNICLAGGVILNSVANYKLYKTGLFKNFFIQPAAGDNGTAIGAAYWGAYNLGGCDRVVMN